MKSTVFLFSILMLLLSTAYSGEILIGTGSKSGVYFQAGRAICRIINRNSKETTCKVLETAGSVSNLANVHGGSIEIGIAQSDMQHYAYNKTGPFKFVDISFSDIRSLFSLYAEPFTLVVRRDAGIQELDDLIGKRVNIGNPGSGQRATMKIVMAAKGWDKDDFQLVTELPASQQTLALCHNRVQAMVYTVGHPNPSVAKAVRLCNAAIAEVSTPEIDNLIAKNPYYVYSSVPGGIYKGIDRPVKTFGVLATVISSADTDEQLVYDIVKNLFENFDAFKRMHRVFHDLEPEEMIRNGLSAPLHKGAVRYYRERGWM